MGFSDLFSPSSSRKNRSYQPRGIPTASDHHYADQNMSNSKVNGKPLSATDKLYYGKNNPNRTMSLTSGSHSYISNNQRSMSMTAGSRASHHGNKSGRKVSNSRANSLTSNQGFSNGSILRGNNASRSNSLTSNNSRTPSRIFKTTTTTTKEQDNLGRTRSITRTTVEQRGDVKIVRTTKTVITPSEEYDVEDPYEGFDDEFITNPERIDFDREMTPVEEYEDDEIDALNESTLQQQQQQQQQQQTPKSIAIGAAAAALGLSRANQHVPKTPQANDVIKRESSTAVSSTPPQENHHAHFKEVPEMINYESDEITEGYLSHDYHSGDSKYPENEKEIEKEIEHELEDAENVTSMGTDDIYEAPLEDEDGEIDFEQLRRNRLSEIAEVTEPFDDSPDKTIGGAPIDSIIIRKPIEDSLELEDTIDMNKILDETESESEEYVEASEILDSQSQKSTIAPIKRNNDIGLGVSSVDPTPNTSTTQHMYRNLLFTDKPSSQHPQQQSPVSSPRKNSIPIFQKNDSEFQKPLNLSINDEDPAYVNTPPQSSDSVKSKPIKSSLKTNSTNTSIISNDGIIPSRMSMLPDTVSLNSKTSYQQRLSSAPKKELTTDEMYAIAVKCAEKKVYGEERLKKTVHNDETEADIETMRNTKINSQSSSINQQHSEQANYQSNAPAKFLIKSMREPVPSKKQSMEITGKDIRQLKKEMEQESKNEKKKWEEQRKSMMSNLRLDQNNKFVSVEPELAQLKHQEPGAETPVKRNVFGFKKSPSHKHSNSVASDVSETSTFKEKLFAGKKAKRPHSISEVSNPIHHKESEDGGVKPVLEPIKEIEPVKKGEVKKEKEKKGKLSFKIRRFFDLN